jgi:polyphosphate kinase
MRSGIIERIEREMEHARADRQARIQIKTNHLVDEETIDALYRASRAGVQVDLLVRTFCGIRAGVPGLSENIRVRSILGRFLEHSRIVYAENDGESEYLIGSADLMHRNLDRRVEAMVRVRDSAAREHLRDVLDCAFADDVVAWELHPDGHWRRNPGQPGRPLRDYQEVLMRRHASRSE